jgi:CreA protein
MKIIGFLFLISLLVPRGLANSSRMIGYVAYNFKLFRSDRIYVEQFDDPKLTNVTCYISRAVLGGGAGIFGAVTDPSRVGLSCLKTGVIQATGKIDESENGEPIFKESESWAFKHLIVTRFFDKQKNVLIYLAWTTEVLQGQPFNIISSVYVDLGKEDSTK